MLKSKMNVYQLDTESSIRDIVNERLEELHITRYDLAHYGGVDGAASTVFRFLSGEANTSIGTVEQVLRACGLAIIAVDDNPEWAQ